MRNIQIVDDNEEVNFLPKQVENDKKQHRSDAYKQTGRVSMYKAYDDIKKKRHEKISKYAIDQSLFETPTMGDFYLGGVDDIYLRRMDALVNGPAETLEEAEAIDGSGKKAAFYTDPPVSEKLGSDGRGHYFFKASLKTPDNFLGNWTNGNTLRIKLSDLSTGEEDASPLAEFKESIFKKETTLGKMTDDDYLTIKMYGINAPYAARWAFEENVPNYLFNHMTVKAADAINNPKYTCDPELIDANEERVFVKVGQRWYQCEIMNETEKTTSFKWMVCPRNGAIKSAEAANAKVAQLINNDTPVYLLIDAEAGDEKSHTTFEYISDDPDACEMLKKWANGAFNGVTNGYCLGKQDSAARFTGTVYFKIDGKWVNLAKAILSDSENNEAAADNLFIGDDEYVFKPTYDMAKQNFADAYFTVLSELDDREKIQKKILGKNWKELKKWTVTIGDVTLMVPPTSIVVSNAIANDTLPVLRGKGSMVKGGQYNVKTLQFQVYFCGENGINGYKYEETSPKDHKLTYSLNGLRALISEFKFTPFLPIENEYINDTLGISAVIFDNLSVNSIPGHPKLLAATVTLREFCYEVYMPEAVNMAVAAGVSNPFSATINWRTMRYYYQKAIMAGDHLRKLGFGINTKEYMYATLLNRTALQPMLFDNNSIDFYVADPEYLDKMLKAKKLKDAQLKNAIQFSDDENAALSTIAEIAATAKDSLESEEFKEACKVLQDISLRIDGGRKDVSPRYKNDESLPRTICIYAADANGNIDKNVDVYDKINAACQTLQKKIKENPYVRETKIYIEQSGPEKKVSFGVEIKVSGLQSNYERRMEHPLTNEDKSLLDITVNDVIQDSTIDKLTNNLNPIIGINDNNEKTFLRNGWIKIPFVVYEDTSKNKGITFDKDDPDAKLFQFALQKKSESLASGDATASTHDDGWMQAPNIMQLNNMKFKKLNTGTFYVTQFQTQLNNMFSDVHLQETNRTCTQFLGGQDISFSVTITTIDKEAVNAIEGIPDLATYMMRKYRQVIPCYPVKIDSEFSRFFGVTEIMIDNVIVSTVENHPGTYNIQLSFHSVDRTMRSRESMEMIQADNAGFRTKPGQILNKLVPFAVTAPILGPFGALAASYGYNQYNNDAQKKLDDFRKKQYKSYFDIMDTISHAELYPDLELPMVDEMQSLGYEFIRYKFQNNRVFVDPDFYFVYMSRLSSQVLRETVIQSIKNGIDGSHEATDMSGAIFSISPAEEKAYDAVANNDIAKSQLDSIKKFNSAKFNLNIKPTKENLIDRSRIGIDPEDYENWEICSDIKAMFMEQRYKKEADSYDARKKNESIQTNSFEQPGAVSSPLGSLTGKSVKSTSETTSVKSTNETSSVKSTNETSSIKSTNETSTVPATGKQDHVPQKYTEGAWVVAKLENANKAATLIESYLLNKPIEEAVPAESACREAYLNATKNNIDVKTSYENVKTEIHNGVTDFFGIPEVRQIMKLLNVDVDNNFIDIAKDIIFASACAATAEKEYSSKKKATAWMPRPDYLADKDVGGSQNFTGGAMAETLEEAIEDGIEFGAFKIHQYTTAEFLSVVGEEPYDVWSEEDKQKSPVNASRFLLDRYYRYQPIDTIRAYKQGCVNSPKYCTIAFMRNMLYWLRRMILDRAFPSINADVLRQSIKSEEQIAKDEAKNNTLSSAKDEDLRQNLKFFTKNAYAIDAGKVWVCAMLALSQGNKMFRDRINTRDYRALNEYIHGVSVPSTAISPDDRISSSMRKANLALAGIGRTENKNAVGVKPDAPSNRSVQQEDNKLYIAAADNPEQYLVHSFHDMIVYDARGRMLRAFPTYYMMFIDEGREVGAYKLHDNFYTSFNILSFDVVKDRKNPADTAHITLTNMYQSDVSEEDERLQARELGLWDSFKTVFSPDTFGQEQEELRQKTAVQDNIMLRAGARIHLRAGYGSNATMLPIIFNGVVAEINSEDTVEIVAQGDGVELCNPIMEEMQAYDIDDKANWLSNGDTPKNIINKMLTTDGGWIAGTLKDLGHADLLGDNPYGIYHFGNKDFKDIVASGEPTQNIFDALPKPVWDEESDGGIILDQAPSISFDVFGKSPWDVINICRSVMPDFVAAVTPFDFRSTIFVGAPRYYYAYSYQNTDGVIHEKRKPFQQFHMYNSCSDIVGNGITATSQTMKTTATGLYQVAASFNTKEQHKVGPLYADIDIYPENQKSMIVDTQLFAKGIPYIGVATNFITSFEPMDALLSNDEEPGMFTGGHNMSAKGIAWRMTASALKDSMKEMYAGDLVVLGDTSIKPHDRVYINDTYTGIVGQVTAREVVHHMSLENGFITTITPDCINVVNDKFERITHSMFETVSSYSAVHTTVVANAARMIVATKTPLATFEGLGKALRPGKIIDAFNSFTSKHELAKDAVSLAEKSMGAGGYIKKGFDWVVKKTEQQIMKQGAKLGLKELVGGAVGATAVGAGVVGTAPAWVTAIAVFIVSSAVIETVGSVFTQMVTRIARNMQVITMYPLKKYGTAWVAGVSGSKGMIYGTPSFKDNGGFTKIVNWMADVNTDEEKQEDGDNNSASGAMHLDPNYAIAGFTANIMDSKELYETCGNIAKHKTGAIDAFGNSALSDKKFNNLVCGSVDPKTGTNMKNDYRIMQLLPRVDYSNADEINKAYKRFAMTNVKHYAESPKLRNMIMISDDNRFKPYIEEGFFKIIHETPALNTGANVDSRIMRLNGVQKYVKVIQCHDANGNPVHDLPLLHRDALNILFEIIRRAKNYMPGANSSDPYETYEETKTSFIALESALRVGDSSYASAGFTFILQGVDNAVEPLGAAIQELSNEIKKDAKEHDLGEVDLFYTNVDEADKTKITVTVKMPKISSSDNENKPAESTEEAQNK